MNVFTVVVFICFISVIPIFALNYAAPAGTIDIRDSQGNEIDPVLNEEIFIVTWVANNYYPSRVFDVEFIITIKDTNELVHSNKQTLKLKLDEVREIKERFVPTKSGVYLVEVKYDQISESTEFIITNQTDSKLADTAKPDNELTRILYSSPLKQYKSGIPAQNVQCREGLQLVMKVSNGHPVCATPSTASRLLQTGWAEPTIITEEGWIDRSK